MIPQQEMKEFNLFLRERRIPDSKKMSCKAIERYRSIHGEITPTMLKADFSRILEDCIKIEVELFNEITREIRKFWITDLLNMKDGKMRFPAIARIADTALAACNNQALSDKDKLSKVVEVLEEINEGISFSLKQSAKTRAGSALQNYLEHFFDILEFEYERQQTIPSGEKLDLIFPDAATVAINPGDCILMECQTTLKDRFRLSLGKAQSIPGITKFIATVTGANLITQRDHADLTKEKIAEIKGKAYRLVALKKVADSINDPTVISFEDFVQKQYMSKASLWW